MFEFNGNTYLSQNDRDMAEINYLQTELAYANKKMEIVESNLAFANSQAESVTATNLELEARVAGAVNELELMRARSLMAEDTIRKAKELIEENLSESDDPMALYAEFREAFELLDVKASRQVAIEISVSWRGTIELPFSVEVDDLDIDDFGISIDGHSEYESDISQYFEDSSIEER